MSTVTRNELISQESVNLIQEVRDYLQNVVVDVEIKDESQKIGAIALGNELQKKFKSLDSQRSVEKKVWDEKSKTVQGQFKPILDQIEQKKSKLSQAITLWDRAVEMNRIEKQRELEDKATKERAALEARAGTREERANMYRKKISDIQPQYGIEQDPDKKAQLWRDLCYYQAKVKEFEDKAEVDQVAASQVQTATYQAEAPEISKGTRKMVVYSFALKDKNAFVAWCLKTDNCHFLIIDEQKLKNRAKECEGKNAPDGLEFITENKTSFSGR